MNCILSETVISLAQAAREIPGNPSPATIWRWHTKGVAGAKLETARVGGKRFTSQEAVSRFLESMNQERASISSSERPEHRRSALIKAGLL